jgi:predicted nucleic acid-binding protein
MICLDASVAVKLILEEDSSDRVEALFFATREANDAIVGPPLLWIEVTNILFQRTRTRGGLTLDEAIAQLERFGALGIEMHNPDGLHRHALALAHVFGLPAAYDAHSLALAEQLDCILWTDDRRLLRAVGDRLPLVRPISEYDART